MRRKLIVLGSGFGAFSLIKEIDTSAYDVIVVSPRNHFLFTPLLPSTTVGTIEFRSIIESIRVARPGVQFYQAMCLSIDTDRRRITCWQELDGSEFTLEYDLLVIAVGASNNTYGIPGVLEHAMFLKELADARAIRQRIIDCFEQASMPGLAEVERKRLVHVVIVGGGPTGVEFAAEMHDFLVGDLQNSFPQLKADVRISLLEATHQILGSFDVHLSSYAIKRFRRQRIEVRTGSIVAKVEAQAVHLADGSVIPYGLLVWSTGIGPRPLVQSLPFEKELRGRIVVDEFLRLRGRSDVFALGDCATQYGTDLPATSQVAQQEGKYLGRMFNRQVSGKPIKPFEYHHLGMLAYIGGNRALADLTSVKGHGIAAWLFWRSAYLTRLVSLRNKILVLFDWCKTFFFGRDISRF